MRCVIGIDLGSTTTKAVLLDERGVIVGRGITNSRSDYAAACAVARLEALTAARFDLLERAADSDAARAALPQLREAFKLELFLGELEDLRATIFRQLSRDLVHLSRRGPLEKAVTVLLDDLAAKAPTMFTVGAQRKSEFFRDLAGAAYVASAEDYAKTDVPHAGGRRGDGVTFEMLAALYDRAILEVETRIHARDVGEIARRAAKRLGVEATLDRAIRAAASEKLEEVAVVGTGYGRQTLPFPREGIRSEILCHGRGAHRTFPGTRTVLDIGGQDTKAIQVDPQGVVSSFQMNDRCAAGCGRYLGYIADELSLGLHELGPLALGSTKTVKVCSTCTVFAGAELRERLALGQKREDILAGLHRAIMLRATSLLARSGGVENELTFTGGVSNNGMAVKVLRELVDENWGKTITLNVHPDSIYMGALGAALFALDDVRAGRDIPLPPFIQEETIPRTSGAPLPKHEGCSCN